MGRAHSCYRHPSPDSQRALCLENHQKNQETIAYCSSTLLARLHEGSLPESGGKAMAAVETVKPIPWWREPTRDQWYAWVAAWLGWTLDAFDFTVFILIMVP